MSRIVVYAATIVLMIATTVAGSNFTVINPEAVEGPPIIYPLDIMRKYGTMLPVEDWRPAN
jgi:hypothetical protein